MGKLLGLRGADGFSSPLPAGFGPVSMVVESWVSWPGQGLLLRLADPAGPWGGSQAGLSSSKMSEITAMARPQRPQAALTCPRAPQEWGPTRPGPVTSLLTRKETESSQVSFVFSMCFSQGCVKHSSGSNRLSLTQKLCISSVSASHANPAHLCTGPA